MLAVGKFLKPFGLKGELKFLSYSGECEHLSKITSFYLTPHLDNSTLLSEAETAGGRAIDGDGEGVRYDIEYWQISSPQSIRCKIGDITTPEDARKFAGQDMYVSEDKAAPVKDGEFYVHELLGATIYCEQQKIGKVKNIYTDAYAPLFEIVSYDSSSQQTEQKEKKLRALVPFRERYFSEPYKQNDVMCIDLLDKGVLFWS